MAFGHCAGSPLTGCRNVLCGLPFGVGAFGGL